MDEYRAYAGIGSRETPLMILKLMQILAKQFRGEGFTLRSGRAPGADQAFEDGAGDKAEIFKPWRAFEKDYFSAFNSRVFDDPTVAAIEAAKEYHPNWGALSRGGELLMGRNMHIVLGQDLDDPVDFIICWTKDGKITGGTGQALRVAESLAIPVYNLCILTKDDVLGAIAEND